MKKKKNLVILLICFITMIGIAGIMIHSKLIKQRELKKQQVLEINYKHQNQAFSSYGGVHRIVYLPYENIEENELFVNLTAYNINTEVNPELTLDDIKDYLSDEYNEDGSLRISSEGDYQNIHDYIDWYFSGGDQKSEDLYDELESINMEYVLENPNAEIVTFRDKTLEQVQELIKKYKDPAYEINAEIMIK